MMNIDITELDWSDRRADTPAEATAKMRWWAMNYGLKQAVCNVTIRERAMIPIPDKRQIYADAANIDKPVPTANDKNSAMRTWCDQNPYIIVTTRSLSEAGNCTPAMARRFITDNPHYFKRIDQYKYEIRNYAEERNFEKAMQ